MSSPMLIVTVTFRLSRSGSVICEARRRIAYWPGPMRRRRMLFRPGSPRAGGKYDHWLMLLSGSWPAGTTNSTRVPLAVLMLKRNSSLPGTIDSVARSPNFAR